MSNIRLLIVDDHPLIVQGLTAALTGQDITCIGSASSVDELLPLYETHRPDVVMLDVRFATGPSGLQGATSLLERWPEARIVFYSQFDQDELIMEAYRLGAHGFVTKQKPTALLYEAIREVHAGQTHILPEIAHRLALIGVRGSDSPRAKLDARELQVFSMLAQGRTNAEIAEHMELSLKTISTIAQHVKDTLGVHRSADITLLAIKHQIIEP
ncbi:response regulator [Burkholderia gladioli]|uniref:response regulator n=1 Tax=Burkholderia gladioli TaxID=28095 RepID=UPI00163F75C1|nr:response regulator transcription factor [Burkholderia gladioli]